MTNSPSPGGTSNDASLMINLPLEERKKRLCESLCQIHGRGRRANESGGEHLYLPCPTCRQSHGHSREAKSKHLAINLDSYFDPNRLFKKSKKGKGKGILGYAMCMKHGGPFSIEELMRYPVQPDAGHMVIIDAPADRYLISDDNGNRIPDHPGKVVPLMSLAHDHPVHQFLQSRDFDPGLLSAQFGCSFCTEEAPEGKQFGNRFYRPHFPDFKSTPQGRLIFNAYVNGAKNCWQGRYLEMKEDMDDGSKRIWVFHPYRMQWAIQPDWAKGEGLVKYLTANGASRNSSLGGYDHVVAHQRHAGSDWCMITEGPLDAAREPNHGLCLFGKHLSDIQALLIRRFFKRVILGFDTDIAGRKACERAEEVFNFHGVKTARFFPGDKPSDTKEDIGDMTYTATSERNRELLATL